MKVLEQVRGSMTAIRMRASDKKAKLRCWLRRP